MPVTTFAAPILPGKTADWRKAIDELNGPRNADYKASRAALGITQEIASLQQTPDGDLVSVFIEAADPDTVITRMFASDTDFDKWFTGQILIGIHGMDAANPPPPNSIGIQLAT